MVEYKAINLVNVGSSPMVEITSYDVIINESYTKSHLSNILLSRPLGATCCCSSLHDDIYKVPAHFCIMTRHLGATLVEIFMSTRQLQVPGCCKHDNPTLGGYRWYAYKGGITSNYQFWANQVLYYYQRNLQSLWPGVIIRLTRHQQQLHDPASFVYNPTILAIINWQDLHL